METFIIKGSLMENFEFKSFHSIAFGQATLGPFPKHVWLIQQHMHSIFIHTKVNYVHTL